MLSHFQEAKKIVQEKIAGGAPPATTPLMEYYRNISEAVMQYFKEKGWIKEEKFNLYYEILLAILVETYKMGRCGEYTALGLIELLLLDIQKGLEKISVEDLQSKTNHTLLIYKRKPDSSLNDPATYGNVIFFDAWPGANQVKEYSGKEQDLISKDDFLNKEIKDVSTISTELLIKEDLEFKDWNEIIVFLELLSQFLQDAEHWEEFRLNASGYRPGEEAKKITATIREYKAKCTKKVQSCLLFSFSKGLVICDELQRITNKKWEFSIPKNQAFFVTSESRECKEAVDSLLPICKDHLTVSTKDSTSYEVILEGPDLTQLKKMTSYENAKQENISGKEQTVAQITKL